ncbi:MAG: hypothetical protein ACJAT5_001124 [Lentimonas sp.]|jgi:hypothetical protein
MLWQKTELSAYKINHTFFLHLWARRSVVFASALELTVIKTVGSSTSRLFQTARTTARAVQLLL